MSISTAAPAVSEAVHTVADDRRLFRQHTEPTHLASPLLHQLCQEWTDLHHSPATRDTLEGWHDRYPALAGLDSPGAITDHIDHGHPDVKDQTMVALLGALHDGDQLAGRILLQAMLPGLTHLARRVRAPRGTHPDETLQRTLTEFWCVITMATSLPARGVAGRLRLDTLHRLTSHRRDSDVWEEHTAALADVLDEDPDSTRTLGEVRPARSGISPTAGAAGAYDPDAGLLELLLHARDAAVISAGDARFLAEVYVLSDNMAHAARRLGRQPAAVRQRCSRLRQRLIAALLDEDEHDRLLCA